MAARDETKRTLDDAANPAVEDPTLAPIRWRTDEEWLEIIDRQARRNLGMSGDEFTLAWRIGTFDDDPDRPEVRSVAMLLPLDE